MYLFLVVLFLAHSFSNADSIKKAIEIAKTGSIVQSERLKIVAENIANESTTGADPSKKPYTRKILLVENDYDRKLQTNLVKIKKITKDKKTPYRVKYDPSHPASQENGIVYMPNVYREIEKVDSIEASKGFEANIAVIDTSKQLLDMTISILKP
jgi:flagellar basal-body rod protein FlgC